VPSVLTVLVVTVTAGVYLAGTRAYRQRRLRAWSAWRTASWLTGAGLLAVGLSPAVEAMDSEPVGHMLQHLLLGMFAPLGLVLGAPVTLLLGSVGGAVRRGVGRVLGSRPFHVLSHPVTAAALSVGGTFVFYLTPLYATSERDAVVHHLVHAHLVAAGYLFTWSVAGPDPARRRPSVATRATVLVLAAGAHGYLAKLLYADAARLPPGSGHPAAQAELAAQWMYYGGDVAELLLAAALFAGWYRLRAAVPARTARATVTE
jgi:putative membrane protein